MILIRYIRYYMSVLNYQNTWLYCSQQNQRLDIGLSKHDQAWGDYQQYMAIKFWEKMWLWINTYTYHF